MKKMERKGKGERKKEWMKEKKRERGGKKEMK